jgi:sugar phosphate permease
VPLRFLVDGFGWRPVMSVAAALLILIGAAIWTIVRDDPAERGYRSFAPPERRAAFSPAKLREDLMTVFRFRNTWPLFFVGCGLTGPVLTFTGLWGVPFLKTQYGITTAESAAITSMLLIFYAIGGLLMGFLSDRIGLRKPVLLAGSVLALFCWAPILFLSNLPVWLLMALVIAVGLTSGSVIIGFAFAKESVPSRFAGTISGVYNMGSIVGAMFLQPAIGVILDLCWRGTVAGGVRIYPVAAYQSGFVLMILCSSLAALAIGFTAETGCRQAGAPDRDDA